MRTWLIVGLFAYKSKFGTNWNFSLTVFTNYPEGGMNICTKCKTWWPSNSLWRHWSALSPHSNKVLGLNLPACPFVWLATMLLPLNVNVRGLTWSQWRCQHADVWQVFNLSCPPSYLSIRQTKTHPIVLLKIRNVTVLLEETRGSPKSAGFILCRPRTYAWNSTADHPKDVEIFQPESKKSLTGRMTARPTLSSLEPCC